MRRINVSAISLVREKIDFTFSDRMPLYKVKQAYADYFAIDRKNLEFRVHGLLIMDNDTAFLINMGTGCTIRVTDKNLDQSENKEQGQPEAEQRQSEANQEYCL